MMNNLHPGLILMAMGFIAAIVPKQLRKVVLILGPMAALAAMLSLPVGTDLSVDFINNYKLGYLYVDKLAYIFGFVFSVIALIGGIYSCHNESRMEALCALGYAGGALGVTFAKDWLTLIFFWESMAITSVFLVWCNHTPESRKAAFRYILVHMLGGNLLLGGIFLKVSQGDMLIANLVGGPHDLAFWAIFLGVAVNTAIPPFNGWISDAYPESTLTGGVFMCSYTTKVAVYSLIRIFAGWDWLLWIGCFMALNSACFAVMENNMRKLLSHHISSQVGFMVAAIGVGSALGLNGAATLAFSNIVYKGLLFMCTGAIIYATGIKRINEIGNVAKKLPLVAGCFFIAALSIGGIPGFFGFVTKPLAIESTAAVSHIAYDILEVASIGTFLSIPLKMGYFIFIRPEKSPEIKRKVPMNMQIAMVFAAVMCVAYGLMPNLIYQYLPFDMPARPAYTAGGILITIEMYGMAMIPFMMYLPKMEPHTAISLDTDWFYRKPFAYIVNLISQNLCALCAGLGQAWFVLYKEFMGLTENPMDFLDAKPFRKRARYNPENYRTSIADPIMITLTVLISSAAYFLFKL